MPSGRRNPLEIRASGQRALVAVLVALEVVIPWKSGQVVRESSMAYARLLKYGRNPLEIRASGQRIGSKMQGLR